MSPGGPLLTLTDVSVAAGDRVLVEGLSLALEPGQFLAVLGRNGCGKSLTLHAIAGLRPARAGQIALAGAPLASLTRRQIARRVALLQQDREETLGLTAFESTLLGRHPHLGAWQRESGADERIARESLARFEVEHCADRLVQELSGGEQRRVAMAGVLAQQPGLYLLDEPTNHLDPHHQVHVLEVFRDLCQHGASIVATLHDPTLAARFADRALLLHGDGRYRVGPVADVLNAQTLSELYLTPMLSATSGALRLFAAG